jgi:predicted negative regulator of RcsB-dependent stress response
MSSEAPEKSHGVEFLAWLEVNKWRVVAAAACLAVAAGGITIYLSLRQEREARASTALLKIQRAAERSSPGPRPSADPFLQMAREFPGTEAAHRAVLLAAGALFEAGKFAEASQQFEAFLRESGGSPFAPGAAFGIAACLDAQGKTNEAAAAYQGILTTYAGSGTANQAKLVLAGLCEARKEYAQAVKLYNELSSPAQPSAWGIEAGMRRENLLRLHPELAPTNTPAPASLPMSVASTGGLSAKLSNLPAASPAR